MIAAGVYLPVLTCLDSTSHHPEQPMYHLGYHACITRIVQEESRGRHSRGTILSNQSYWPEDLLHDLGCKTNFIGVIHKKLTRSSSQKTVVSLQGARLINYTHLYLQYSVSVEKLMRTVRFTVHCLIIDSSPKLYTYNSTTLYRKEATLLVQSSLTIVTIRTELNQETNYVRGTVACAFEEIDDTEDIDQCVEIDEFQEVVEIKEIHQND